MPARPTAADRSVRPRAALTAVLGVLAVGLLGCVTDATAPLRSPAEGGPRWTQLVSPHFTMSTDVPADLAQLTLADFELDHARLAAVLPHPDEAPGQRIAIVLFERPADYRALTGKSDIQVAFFRERGDGDLEDAPTLVLGRGETFTSAARVTFLHELTHRFLHQRSARLPRWLDEGLAEYYATLRAAGDKVIVGLPATKWTFAEPWEISIQRRAYAEMRATGRIPVAAAPPVPALLAAGSETFYGAPRSRVTDADRGAQLTHYAASYRLVHLLRNGLDAEGPARFDAFVTAVERGARAEVAFAAAYGDPAAPAVEARYRSYLTAELHPVEVPFVAARGVPRVVSRPMTSGEVLDLWSRLRPWRPGTLETLRRDLDQAVLLDHGSAEARYQRGILALRQKRFQDAFRDFEAALAAAPREPRYLLARALVGRAAVRAGLTDPALPAVFNALASAATSPGQLNEVAWVLGMFGRPAAGLPFIERALVADRTCHRCEDTLAVLLFAAGRAPEAIAAMDRAIALLPDDHASSTYLARREVLGAAAALVPAPGAAATPGLSPAVLAAVTRLYDAPLRVCPERRGPDAPRVRARIGPEGSVRAAWPTPPATDERPMACTLAVVREMLFPPFQGEPIEVTLPPG